MSTTNPETTTATPAAGDRRRVVARRRRSTRSTRAASPTPTVTAPATSPACGPASRTWPPSGSTPSGSPRGTPRRWPTAATTSPTTARIDPLFGDLAEAEGLIADALTFGIRTIIDVVPNHVSAQHPWFQPALAAGPGSPERERFWFRDGLGTFGAAVPNRLGVGVQRPDLVADLQRRRRARAVVPPPVRPGPARPELAAPRRPPRPRGDPAVLVRPRRGRHPDRLGRPGRQGPRPARGHAGHEPGEHPYVDRDELQEIYRSLAGDRRLLRRPRVLVGEVWLPDAERFARYLRPGVLHTAFNFDFMAAPWDASLPAALRRAHPRRARAGRRAGHLGAVQPRRDPAGDPLRAHRHGVRVRDEAVRHPHRPRRSAGAAPGRPHCWPWRCPARSTSSRARSSGLPEVEVPRDRIEDPMHARSGGVDPGRDGCRVPLPWAGEAPPYGFSRRRWRPGCPSRPTGPP